MREAEDMAQSHRHVIASFTLNPRREYLQAYI